MAVKVRQALEALGHQSLVRLKNLRNEEGSQLQARGIDELRNALSRSYGRDPENLFHDMLQAERAGR